MDYFPLFARLTGQRCLVVGGGEVALRKIRELRAADAAVVVNALQPSAGVEALAAAGDISLIRGPFQPELVATALLVVAATDDTTVNATVAAAARGAQRLCNVVDDGEASSFIMPAVVDRSPVIVAVSTGGAAPVLARRLRQELEALLPPQLGALAAWSRRWRARVRAALPTSGARRALWERLLDGPVAARVLAGDAVGADHDLELALREAPAPATGRAWLVGAGPGDPGLISVRGLAALRAAEVVLYDRLVAPELLRAARREAELVNVGKTGAGPSASQADINALLLQRVRAGRRVVRLKGGDPLVFGRGGEEAQALAAAGLPFEIVPGITAASACAASTGIPLTHRGLATAVSFVTAHTLTGETAGELKLLATGTQTLAIYMGGARVGELAALLVEHGRPATTPAALVVNGSRPDQQLLVGTLADIGARCTALATLSPALLLVGECVALAGELGLAGGPPAQGEWSFATGMATTTGAASRAAGESR